MTPEGTAVDFNADLAELRQLAREVLATDPPAPGRLPITPPAMDPTIGRTPEDLWPYDEIASFQASGDLLIGWRHERNVQQMREYREKVWARREAEQQ